MPPFTVGQKPFGKWNWKYATAISPARTKATGRVNRPRRTRPPPNTSRAPPSPSSEIHGTVPPFGGTPAGNANSFVVPASMNMYAAAMRSTLLKCGSQAGHFACMVGEVTSRPVREASRASRHGDLDAMDRRERVVQALPLLAAVAPDPELTGRGAEV